MYISRITLDLRKRTTALAVSDRAFFHKAIEASYSGGRQRPVWEVDEKLGKRYLTIISIDKPNLDMLQEKYGDNSVQPVIEPYDETVSEIKDGDIVAFHTTVAPIYQTKDRKEIPLNLYPTEKYPNCAMSWMENKLVKIGAQPIHFENAGKEKTFFSHGGTKIPITLMTFEGYAKITNSAEFKEAIFTGIGRKKAYGAGILMAKTVSAKPKTE